MATLEEAISTGRGIERPFNCHVHDDNNASASVNIEKGVWCCYACGARGKVGEAQEFPDFSMFHRSIEKTLQPRPEPYAESWLDVFDSGQVHPYWLSRFSEDTCRKFRLGYDFSVSKPCYPLRYPNGSVAGVVHRSIDGSHPKYRYPYGVDIGKLLFNYRPFIFDELWLVEGAMDAIALDEAGYDAFAIYGSRLKESQIDLIIKCEPKKIVLCFDKDRAGSAAKLEASQILAAKGFNVYQALWDSELGKDPAELSVKQRRDIMVAALVR